jgi:hypothetical protein
MAKLCAACLRPDLDARCAAIFILIGERAAGHRRLVFSGQSITGSPIPRPAAASHENTNAVMWNQSVARPACAWTSAHGVRTFSSSWVNGTRSWMIRFFNSGRPWAARRGPQRFGFVFSGQTTTGSEYCTKALALFFLVRPAPSRPLRTGGFSGQSSQTANPRPAAGLFFQVRVN